MITIRRAVPGDMKEMCRMALAMHPAGSSSAFSDMSVSEFAETIADLAINDTGAVFVAETDGKVCGMAAVTFSTLWFNTEHKVGQELFWWVDKEARVGHHVWKALLKAVEMRAKESGCKTYLMGSSCDLSQDRLKIIYARLGYVAKDVLYIKEL